MSHILLIFGTRPEAIKMAPLVRTLQTDSRFNVTMCVTAQHREMLDQVLDWFEIRPDYDLDLMRPNQTLAGITARAINGISEIIAEVNPDAVLVQGDTTTAMTGALAGFYNRVKVGHVEAGLRTDDIYNPFPEEVNRRLISVIGNYHFAPTKTAERALLREGTNPNTVYVVGNTVIDALHWTVSKEHNLPTTIPLPQADEKLIMITAHRRESFGIGFEAMCKAFLQIAENHKNARLVYPVHLNPNVQEPVHRILSGSDRIHLLDPLPYPDFAHLMARADIILTDSGGIQEEAPSLGKPVIVMRTTTERPEAVEAGVAKLVGTDADTIVEAVSELLTDQNAYDAMANAVSPFGDGTTSRQIADILAEAL